ncbi:MDS1 and EVI1 complex locus protein EVI1-like [Trichogramma pretiosum]|uniref:MDS1 and EVI1 complex locus protein EVI1-like n=1 Tax=Trichogramma pretiosum TaxID=7493 RepID=UPI0006C9E32D|nr:MDS1 and EVI1 complex locus protein EVI1-like [Trichogramma pretiosum]
MESRKDSVSVKEEPFDNWTDVGNDYADPMDSCKAENFKESSFDELSANHTYKPVALQERSDKKILVDFVSDDVKPELKSSSASICQTEYQSFQPIVKFENEIQTYDINDDIYSDFECRDVKPELKSSSKLICKTEYQICQPIVKLENETQTHNNNDDIYIDFECRDVKSELKPSLATTCQPTVKIENQNRANNLKRKRLIVLINKEYDYDNNCRFQKKFRLKKHNESKIRESSLKTHLSTTQKNSRSYECELCHKSLRCKRALNNHINAVHNRSKPFECEICHKLFGQNGNLKTHINAVVPSEYKRKKVTSDSDRRIQ